MSQSSYEPISLEEFRKRLKPDAATLPLQHGGGGGTFNGMEARVAKLEAGIDHIQRDIADVKVDMRGLRSDARTDFRLLFGALIAVALGLAAMMARGFGWM